MARNEIVALPQDTWTQLTNGDVTALTLQNLSGCSISVNATVGETAPGASDGGIEINPGNAVLQNLMLADLFPGVAGAKRVWALCPGQAGKAMVSHG